jgi:hypothetical protein
VSWREPGQPTHPSYTYPVVSMATVLQAAPDWGSPAVKGAPP